MPKGLGRAGMDDKVSIGQYGDNVYMALPVCPLVVFPISRSKGEIELLCWEAASILIAMSPIIKRDFDFIGFDVENIGEVGQTEEYKEFWTAPIGIVTKFAEAWEITEEGNMLEKVLINAYTKLISDLEPGYGSENYGSGEY